MSNQNTSREDYPMMSASANVYEYKKEVLKYRKTSLQDTLTVLTNVRSLIIIMQIAIENATPALVDHIEEVSEGLNDQIASTKYELRITTEDYSKF